MRVTHKEILEKAKNDGYLLAKWGKTDAVEEEYYGWCEKEGIPLIKAYAGSKYSTVSVDMITTSYNLNEEGQKRIGRLFRKYTRKPSSVGVGHGYCSVDDIPIDSVDVVVKDLMLIYETCKAERTNNGSS